MAVSISGEIPGPWSETCISISTLPSARPNSRTATRIVPSVENLTALCEMLSSTCQSRVASELTQISVSRGSKSASMVRPFSAARGRLLAMACSSGSNSRKGRHSMESWPERKRAVSSRSLISEKSRLPDSRACLRYPLSSATSSVMSASCSMPSRPLSGVRIPCDMQARKWSLERFSRSSSIIWLCFCSTRRRASTSSPTQTAPMTAPLASTRGSAESWSIMGWWFCV
mmetsp:Transcript_14878/g.45452  ORF Transcript_14878/g.45452 Transcript_14878/m.45452 type:complete len:229 (-) Transcript_14878:993-1679(-)